MPPCDPVTPDQIDLQISELESRLERLRVLYEQYFMGFERMEPAIARKDVERRVHDLRKTRFPTTAKRFKFQTIIQRYSSLVQYWTRTCRDIENGTYRKHRIKARKRFANESSRPGPPDAQERAEAATQAKDAASADLAGLMDSDVDLDAALGSALSAAESASASGGGKSLAALGASKAAPAAGGSRTSGLKLSLPNIKVKERSLNPTEGSKGQVPGLAPLQIRTSAMPGSLKKSLAPAPAASGLSPRKQAEALQKKALELQQKKLAESSLVKSSPKPKLPVAPGPKASLTAAAPAPAPTPKAAAPAPKAQAPAPRAASSLSEDRIRALHASYCDARTKTNARPVSFEKLSKSIRETEEKIRVQSKGRSVDFDVTIQGGKAILKPKLK